MSATHRMGTHERRRRWGRRLAQRMQALISKTSFVHGTKADSGAFWPAGRAGPRVRRGEMTQTSNRILDEFAKLMTDAAGVAQGVRREVETAFRSQAERFLGEMDIVQREEFEAVREMASRAREENEALKKRLDELETRLGGAGVLAADAAAEPVKRGARKRTGAAASETGGEI